MADLIWLSDMGVAAWASIQGFASNQSELISALLGAFVGGWFTSKATKRAHALQSEERRVQDAELLKNTLTLISSELGTGWDIYKVEFAPGLLVLPENKPYMNLFPIGQNPFPIYDSAPACLAEAPPVLAASIVHIYMRAKGLIETINLNNEAFRLAGAHARDAVRLARRQNAEGSVDLNAIYDSELEEMGFYLNMGGLAGAMRALTLEIDDCLGVLVKDIDDFVSGVDSKSKF